MPDQNETFLVRIMGDFENLSQIEFGKAYARKHPEFSRDRIRDLLDRSYPNRGWGSVLGYVKELGMPQAGVEYLSRMVSLALQEDNRKTESPVSIGDLGALSLILVRAAANSPEVRGVGYQAA